VYRASLEYMLFSLLVLLVGLVVAGLTMLYVTYPRRGQAVPRVPWLGEALQRRVEALPTIEPEETVERHLIRR
jgi:hypothetical protein